MEHRYGTRVSCDHPVRVHTGTGVAGTGRLADISLSGAFLVSALPLPVLSLVRVYVPTARRLRGVLLAQVVRTTEGGYGLEWSEGASSALTSLLRSAAGSYALSARAKVTRQAARATSDAVAHIRRG